MCLLPLAAAAQVLEIRVAEGEGAVHRPGGRAARPLSVVVSDETGQPVAGAAVTFQLPSEGPGGTFSNGLRTDVALTDERGQARARMLFLNQTNGPFRIRITAVKNDLRAGTVSAQYIGPGGAVGPAREPTPVARAPRRGWWKWALVAAGAAAGGAVVGLRSGGDASATPAKPTGITIGAPSTISVGKP